MIAQKFLLLLYNGILRVLKLFGNEEAKTQIIASTKEK